MSSVSTNLHLFVCICLCSPMDPGTLGELCDLMSNGTISSKIGKKIMSEIFDGNTRSIQEVRGNLFCSIVNFLFEYMYFCT